MGFHTNDKKPILDQIIAEKMDSKKLPRADKIQTYKVNEPLDEDDLITIRN